MWSNRWGLDEPDKEPQETLAEIPFGLSKPFLINLRLAPGDSKNLPFGLRTVEIAYLPLRQDLLSKTF
jgi:hypothetical protein